MEIYTIQNWEDNGAFSAEIGQLVTFEVVSELCIDGYIYGSIGFAQQRDAYSHERTRSGRNVPLYHTFIKRGEYWKYLGCVPALHER